MEVWRAAVLKRSPEVENVFLAIWTKRNDALRLASWETSSEVFIWLEDCEMQRCYTIINGHKKTPHGKVTEIKVTVARGTQLKNNDFSQC